MLLQFFDVWQLIIKLRVYLQAQIPPPNTLLQKISCLRTNKILVDIILYLHLHHLKHLLKIQPHQHSQRLQNHYHEVLFFLYYEDANNDLAAVFFELFFVYLAVFLLCDEDEDAVVFVGICGRG